jgi:hypothetical protein
MGPSAKLRMHCAAANPAFEGNEYQSAPNERAACRDNVSDDWTNDVDDEAFD